MSDNQQLADSLQRQQEIARDMAKRQAQMEQYRLEAERMAICTAPMASGITGAMPSLKTSPTRGGWNYDEEKLARESVDLDTLNLFEDGVTYQFKHKDLLKLGAAMSKAGYKLSDILAIIEDSADQND